MKRLEIINFAKKDELAKGAAITAGTTATGYLVGDAIAHAKLLKKGRLVKILKNNQAAKDQWLSILPEYQSAGKYTNKARKVLNKMAVKGKKYGKIGAGIGLAIGAGEIYRRSKKNNYLNS